MYVLVRFEGMLLPTIRIYGGWVRVESGRVGIQSLRFWFRVLGLRGLMWFKYGLITALSLEGVPSEVPRLDSRAAPRAEAKTRSNRAYFMF